MRSSDIRYRTIVGPTYCNVLYSSKLNDEDRKLITRWCLSNHNLRIKKGRYTKPFTPREQRLCVVCNVLEDEVHALFSCKVHASVRVQFKSLLNRYTSVNAILNQTTVLDATEIASFLRHIENNVNLLYEYKSPTTGVGK